MSARLLVVYGGRQGGRTERLRDALLEGARRSSSVFELRARPALEADTNDLLWCNGIVLATPEHFGYMSGALKDFFDRTFYAVEGRTEARPYALIVSAGNDGRGTVSAVDRIVNGYRWTAVAEPLVIVGEPDLAALERCRELGEMLVAGLEAGIF